MSADQPSAAPGGPAGTQPSAPSGTQPGAPGGTPPGSPTSGGDEYVITTLGASSRGRVNGVPGGASGPGDRSGLTTRTSRLPAIIEESPLARELVIHAASFVHGVRRAVAPETILKVRAEMKREIKRARKARKAEMKAALREYRARHRADVPPDTGGTK